MHEFAKGAKNDQSLKGKVQKALLAFEPIIYQGLIGLCMVLSAYVIFCELFIMLQFSHPLMISHNIVLVYVALFYLSLTTYYGLFNIRICSIYSLDASGHTDSFSLLYSARTLTGLASPLCFNFLKMTNMRDTQFHTILNPMDSRFL